MSIEDIKHSLKSDDRWKRYRGIITSVNESFPLESLQQELDTIQRMRKVRTVNLKGVSPQRLLDMSMDEVQHRARLTEILIQAKKESALVDTLLDGMYAYIKGEYSEELKDWKSQADRNSVVERLLSKGYETQSGIASLMETVETLIKDIDQSSFTLTRAANLLELIIRRENIASVNI